jgi:hypothetical protein
MRLHSDTLTRDEIHAALTDADIPGVFIDVCTAHGSRPRSRGFEIRLAACEGRDRNGKKRRPRNTGTYGGDGHDPYKGATYDEWGYFIAELFERDPEAIFGPYNGRDGFHKMTNYDYAPTAA